MQVGWQHRQERTGTETASAAQRYSVTNSKKRISLSGFHRSRTSAKWIAPIPPSGNQYNNSLRPERYKWFKAARWNREKFKKKKKKGWHSSIQSWSNLAELNGTQPCIWLAKTESFGRGKHFASDRVVLCHSSGKMSQMIMTSHADRIWM